MFKVRPACVSNVKLDTAPYQEWLLTDARIAALLIGFPLLSTPPLFPIPSWSNKLFASILSKSIYPLPFNPPIVVLDALPTPEVPPPVPTDAVSYTHLTLPTTPYV